MTQPLWGWDFVGVYPGDSRTNVTIFASRTARASHPWALGRNPVGIRNGLRSDAEDINVRDPEKSGGTIPTVGFVGRRTFISGGD